MCCHHRCVYKADKKCRLNAIYALSKIQTNDFVCIERGDYGLLANLKQFILNESARLWTFILLCNECIVLDNVLAVTILSRANVLLRPRQCCVEKVKARNLL